MQSIRFTAAAAVFAAASLALAWFLTGFGAESAGDRLAEAGSPVSPPVIALIVALVLGGIVFLVVGARRRNRD